MTTEKYTQDNALEILDADKTEDGYIYRAEETGSWYRFSDEDLQDFVDLLNSDDDEISRSAYSHWCASYGEEIDLTTLDSAFPYSLQDYLQDIADMGEDDD